MVGNKIAGDKGEKDVIKKVRCPNCTKALMGLPKNYPMYDVQCTGCIFRAQVKTNNSKPKSEIFGAGWDIIEKVMKAGFVIPALFANFVWEDKEGSHQEIRFYPFVPKTHLKMRQLSPTARRANYRMFNYVGIDKLPHFVVYKKTK
jgi:hypothetical protein